MSINIQSFNQILGNMVRKIIAETPLSDINPGSILLSLLEACASNDFENNVAILNILELLNIDAVRNSDLDNKAADFGLTREIAVAASGVVSFLNKNITKQSTSLYNLKPAPISGQTVLFVNDTTGWASSGSIYIGRGTNSFEGPITYTSITTFSTYSQINLGSALQNNHLSSDIVINAQGQPDRVINAGTLVKIPANNQNPQILYSSVRTVILPSGEDRVDGALVRAAVAGSQGNAIINTITQFDTIPFSGAGVSNTSSFSSGSDIETDVQLRNRIKSYAASLARGTSPAILSAVIGVSDPDENKRVVSAVLAKPVSKSEPSILYIDDGSGFQPSYAGQPVDVLISTANGTEEFLQLANFPLPRPQVVNTGIGPFVFLNNMFFRVAVDGAEETITFSTSDFANISVASISEIVAAINLKSALFKARLTNDFANMLVYPIDPNAEIIQVVPLRSTDDSSLYANNLLIFPTAESSYIALFQNSTRLKQKTKSATVETVPFASWNLLTPGDLIISVDGTPAQDGAFTIADFTGASSFTSLTLTDWVNTLNAKFAGITAVATPGQTMQISSNKNGNSASINILGGTYETQMFATNSLTATGQASEFNINRQTGTIQLLNTVSVGDSISAGVADSKGFVVSTSTISGTYDFDVDSVGRPAEVVVVVDSTKCNIIAVSLELGETLQIIDEGSSKMRILASSLNVFQNVQPGHFIYIVSRTSSWVSSNNSGLFRVVDRGTHLVAGTDSYIEVLNDNITNQTVTVADVSDVTAFDTDVYPQIWRGTYLLSPVSASLTDVINSFTTSLQGVDASIFRANSVKLTSTTEVGGSIAIPVSVGTAKTIFAVTATVQANNQPLIANKISQKDMLGFLKLPVITSGNQWLDRAMYPTITSSLSATSIPDSPPYSGAYSETITGAALAAANINYSDLVLFTRGDNKQLIRSIAATPGVNEVGTQQGTPRTLFNHVIGDEVLLAQSLKFSADDTVVCVMDQDATLNTINIKAARTAQVNSGSSSGSFIPTTTEFSANDSDNQTGVDFGNVTVWGTDINNTNFSDYAILMRARNWYASGGTGSSKGKIVIRSVEYGPNGNKMRFNINYPANPSLTKTTVLTDTPSYNTLTYFFGSGVDRAIALTNGVTFTVTGPYNNTSINFPAGAGTSGNYYDYTFSAGTFTSVQINDVISFLVGSGVGNSYLGQFGVWNKSGSTIRVFNPNATPSMQTISNVSLTHLFPLVSTLVSDIITAINASNVLVAAAISSTSLNILASTAEDQYSYSGNATALGYGHNPTSGTLRDHIGLYDGINWINSFQNANPNFTTKTPFTLTSSGVSSSIYGLNTTLNEDSTSGEYLKLVPTTIKNVQHHFTQKALSQLPILASIEISDAGKNSQIVSDQLGSAGAVQILGGQANKAQTSLLDTSEIVSDSSGSYIRCNISAFPNSYAVGDVVQIQNQIGVSRLSQLLASDSISVATVAGNNAEYYWNPKTTNFTSGTTLTITDVSSSYLDYSGNPLAAGMVWRWTHSIGGAETLATVIPGNQVMAFGSLSGWSQGNQVKLAGDETVSGLPIIAVNDGAHYFDVVCPFGKAMGATSIGSGTVNICPTPKIKWNVAHAAKVQINTLVRTSNVMAVDCFTAHNLNTGDSVSITDSNILTDGTYGTVTVTSATAFTFSNSGSNVTEPAIGASLIKSTLTQTKYRLQKLGFNNMTRISRTSGTSPRFADSGVAVDDYLTISGTTFSSLNNGTYRVLAVDNDSVVFTNPNTVENLNTVLNFNNQSLSTTWTANSAVVTGSAGAFKNLSLGNWVKKQGDSDSLLLQVIAHNNGSFAAATQITLGLTYSGISGIAFGVAYDQTNDFDQGVFLQNNEDIAFYDGDATIDGDTLFIQSIVNTSWFSPNNTGSFPVIKIGSNPSDHRPFVRVNNSLAVTETNRSMSVNIDGLYIVESELNKFSSYRLIANSVVSDINNLQRSLYLLPDSRQYKFSQANTTYITHTAKLGYDLDVTIGTDGYLYYTGLLRRVQRTVDGFSPDPVTFPERKAIGSTIETLPPLVNNISVVLTITTDEGVVLQDVSNNIKSAIIDYVNNLGVNQDVVLSQIIAKIIQVKGVADALFNTPPASQGRITIAPNEKAVISANNIGLA